MLECWGESSTKPSRVSIKGQGDMINEPAVIGKCNRQDTSSIVMVISSVDRWKKDVLCCHLSRNAFTKLLFAVGYNVLTRLANLDWSTWTLTCGWVGYGGTWHHHWQASSLAAPHGSKHAQNNGPCMTKEVSNQLDLLQMAVQQSYQQLALPISLVAIIAACFHSALMLTQTLYDASLQHLTLHTMSLHMDHI